jgi:hypothetical protein
MKHGHFSTQFVNWMTQSKLDFFFGVFFPCPGKPSSAWNRFLCSHCDGLGFRSSRGPVGPLAAGEED